MFIQIQCILQRLERALWDCKESWDYVYSDSVHTTKTWENSFFFFKQHRHEKTLRLQRAVYKTLIPHFANNQSKGTDAYIWR